MLRHPYVQNYESRRAHNKEFVDLSNGEFGMAILSEGLQEHEIVDQETDAVALTLIRSVGWIYRESMGEVPTPEGQCQGRMTARYAIFPHAAGWKESGVKEQARRYCAGVFSRHLYAAEASKPNCSGSLIEMEGAAAFSALKPAHDGKGVIVRVYQPSAESASVKIRFPSNLPSSVCFSAMNEEPGELLAVQDGAVQFKMAPYHITTLRICWSAR